MSSLAHARTAIAIAAGLNALDQAGIRRVVQLAQPFLAHPLPESGPRSLAVLAGQPPLTARERLSRLLEPAVVEVFLPALRERIVAALAGGAPDPGAPSALDCAEAFRILRDLVCTVQVNHAARAEGVAVAKAILLHARACTDDVGHLLEREDYPDLAALSNDLLRLEGLRWLTEVLADAPAHEAIRQLSRRLARVTLTRATATMRTFLKQRDLLALFDNAGVISQVDNLVVVTLRVLDSLAAVEDEPTAFVPTADETALDEFLHTLAALGETLLQMLSAATGRPGRERFFPSLVRQLECVCRIAAHLQHGARPQVLDDVERTLRTRLTRLSVDLAERLGTAAASGGDLELLLSQAAQLCAAFERLGLAAEAGTLVIRVRAVRQGA